MNRLILNAAAFIRLGAQLKLNGTFNHTLRNDQRVSMAATVEVEQCSAAVYVLISIGRSRNSITLDRNSKTAANRLALYIESIANGEPPVGVTEVDEYLLASATEIMLRTAIRLRRGTHYLPIEGLDDICLLLRKTSTGRLIATLEAEDVILQLLLPRSAPDAYAMLAENVERFIAGHRAALAA